MHFFKRWLNIDVLPAVMQHFLLVVAGVSVIFMHNDLLKYVHIVVGLAVIIVCALMLAGCIRSQSYQNRHDRKLPTALVGLVLGTMILIYERGSIPFIAVAWGISGLESGITELDHAVHSIVHRKAYAYHLIHGIVETVLAVMLVFDPTEKLGEHIVILGLEMLVQAITIQEKEEMAGE